MQNKIRICLYPLTIVGFFLMFISCTVKDLTQNLPVLTIDTVRAIGRNSATFNGVMTSTGGSLIRARGFCLSKNPNPTLKDSVIADTAVCQFNVCNVNFKSVLTNLTRNTKYYVSAYATNSSGTGYKNADTFSTLAYTILFNPNLIYDSVKDVDHNRYNAIKIGTQTWMAENLRTTHYRNGYPIVNVANASAWANLMTGACCDYNNLPGDSLLYGKLYNWYAVTDSRNIAPVGWHVPTYAEWNTLITYLGGNLVASEKLKEAGTINWLSPNFPYVATYFSNLSGFTGIPGGMRDKNGQFNYIGVQSHWWSSIAYKISLANSFYLKYGSNSTSKYITSLPYADTVYYNRANGCSLRCIKDN